jgi:hypothetical protein
VDLGLDPNPGPDSILFFSGFQVLKFVYSLFIAYYGTYCRYIPSAFNDNK